MKKIIYTILGISLLLNIASCETVELDLLEDPTQVNQDQLDPQFLFNNIQLSFNGFVSLTSGFGSFSSEVTRERAMTAGPVYESAFNPVSLNGVWSTAYAGVLQDVQTLENVEGVENFNYHLGVSKVMRAYVLFTLVDLFGDVPFEDALQGATIQEPEFQDQVEVYNIALTELNEARSLLAAGGGIEPLEDFYFGVSANSQSSWITVANTIELRALSNARLAGDQLGINIASRITDLLNEDNLIDSPTEDFQFQYGPNRVNPNTRHPAYSTNYENGGAVGYIANYMMWELSEEKGFDDPRLRYYFYRQDTNANNEDIFTLGCAAQSAPGHYSNESSIYDPTIDIPFCTASPARGYWGRDHGDARGIPPDGEKRTVHGVYPAGGLFDADQADDTQNNGTDGLLGAGIQPIFLSSYTEFVKAEIALTLGIGNAEASLEAGIRASMDKVLGFGDLDPSAVITPDDPDTPGNEEVLQGDFFPSTGNVENYITFVMDAFAAADANEKLNILMKEYHIASYGNGMETYNAYRRTGFPDNMQPTINPNPGDFYRAALYPANSVNNNVNSQSADRTRQVFWDTNPAGFIN